jgi:hypothetical protein
VVKGVGTFIVESDRARDVRRDLFQLVSQQRWGLLELRALGLTLEEVFLRAVTGEEPGAGEEPEGEAARPDAGPAEEAEVKTR